MHSKVATCYLSQAAAEGPGRYKTISDRHKRRKPASAIRTSGSGADSSVFKKSKTILWFQTNIIGANDVNLNEKRSKLQWPSAVWRRWNIPVGTRHEAALYLILLITCCRCHTDTRDHLWTIVRKMALQVAKWVGRDRWMLFQKGLNWECTWIVSQKPTTVVQFAAGLVRGHPGQLPAEELRPRPASIFLWSLLPSFAFFCNVIEETSQLRSSSQCSHHLFKQFSLYLHAWPINVFTNTYLLR
jgi:hypothetical protein